MRAPTLPPDFFPEEDMDERIARWLVLEQEAAEMQRQDRVAYEPQPPRMPHWLRDCTNESALRSWGYM